MDYVNGNALRFASRSLRGDGETDRGTGGGGFAPRTRAPVLVAGAEGLSSNRSPLSPPPPPPLHASLVLLPAPHHQSPACTPRFDRVQRLLGG